MIDSEIMKQRIVLILTTLLFGSLHAQDSVRPVYYDYNYIELNLTLIDSEGHPIIFFKRNNEPTYYSTAANILLNDTISSRKEHRMMSFYNQYRIGSCCPKDLPELECFYKKIYENRCETPYIYGDSAKPLAQLLIEDIEDFNVFSKDKTVILPVDYYSPYVVENYLAENNSKIHFYKEDSNLSFFEDEVKLCYWYAASDNVVYDPTDLLGERVVETPYFVPIGYLELYFVEDNKLMHIDFELYDYKKMGFTRPVYDPKTGVFPHLKLFMEIQFQEGEFVVTDESYPNLKQKKY